jgi:ATP-dependent Lhr-like helicase
LDKPEEAQAWVTSESGVAAEASRQVVAYLEEGKRVLGMIPTGKRVIAERFFDESGGMQLVIHAPFGAGVNRAWGMALRKQICRAFDFELQASATDEGLNFSLGPNPSFPLDEVFSYIKSYTAEKVLRQSVLQAPVFGTRWRWNATRALAILRHTGGRKVPAPLLRMRSDDLLAAVFPAQLACQDNAMPGDIEIPDNPLAFETMRDCLTEAMDLEGLIEVLSGMERGEIEVYAKDTVQPSVFSHQILNAMPYAFLDDAPLEERRARAVSLRRALPDDSRDLSALDAQAVIAEGQNAWPRVRDKDELHDALLVLGILPEDHASDHKQEMFAHKPLPEQAQRWYDELSAEGRAYKLDLAGSVVGWVAAERLALVQMALTNAMFQPTPPTGWIAATELDQQFTQEDAILSLVRGWVECSGPLTATYLSDILGLELGDVSYALAQLENEGLVLRGRFKPGFTSVLGAETEEEFCDRRILARIHRATIGRLRKEVEPVTPAPFLRFLSEWQHASPGSQLHGDGGLLDIIELLQGFEAAAGAWEPELLSTRMADYKPLLLDRLCLGGEAVWGRFSQRRDSRLSDANGSSSKSALTRTTPVAFALRESLEWLLDRPISNDSAPGSGLSGATLEVAEALGRRGASFLSEIISATRRLPSDVEEALWQLASAGKVTADGLDPLRQRINGKPNHRRNDLTTRRAGRHRRTGFSRWSLLVDPDAQPDGPDGFSLKSVSPDKVEAKARQLLRRYGILFPELLAREPMAPRWRELVRVLRRLEARGEIRGGRFVSGFIGEQFALPETIEALRASRKQEPNGRFITVSACDPLNLVGILSPGERVPAVLGNRIVFKDGVAMCSLESGNVVDRIKNDGESLAKAREQLFISHAIVAPSTAPDPVLTTG